MRGSDGDNKMNKPRKEVRIRGEFNPKYFEMQLPQFY